VNLRVAPPEARIGAPRRLSTGLSALRSLRALLPLLAALLLVLASATGAHAAKGGGKSNDQPEVVGRAVKLGVKDRMAGLALVEAAATNKAEPEVVPWAALYAGELRRLIGDGVVAKAWFQRVVAEHADSGLKDAASLGIALVNAEDGPSGNVMATLQLIADKNVPASMNADRYRMLARDAADQGSNPSKVREYVKKALSYAEGDPAQVAKIRGSLSDLLSAAQTEEIAAATGGSPVNNELDAFLRIKEAMRSGRAGEAQRQGEQFLTTWPTSPKAPEVKLLLKRAAGGDKTVAGKVGVIIPMSGQYASVGKQLRQVIELANARSGGHLELAFVDSQLHTGKIGAAVEDLVINQGAVALLGPLLKEDVADATRTAQGLGVPMVTLSQGEDATKAGDYVFRGFLSVEEQVAALVEHAMKDRSFSRFAVLYPSNGYGDTANEAFLREVKARGGTVVSSISYAADAREFLGPARKLRGGRASSDGSRASAPLAVDVDAIFIPDNAATAPLVASALAYEEFPVGSFRPGRGARPIVLMGLNGWNNPKIVEAGGQYMRRSVFVDAFDPGLDTGAVTAFVTTMESATGRTPRVVDALAWDCTQLLSLAVLAGGADRDAIRKELGQVVLRDPVAGGARFGEDREVDRALTVFSLEPSGIRPWAPSLQEP
jgi:branched-chain amino acid transport system substrate-binding protein